MSTTTAVRTATLPRVNLLPPEIAEGVRFRNAQAAMGLALFATLAVVGGLTYLASTDVSSAQEQLTTAQTEQTKLQAEAAQYANAPKVYAQVAVAQAQMATAMGQEIRYSYVLKDLSLYIPAGVWLEELKISQPVDTPNTIKGAWGNPGVASVSFTGKTLKLTDVAAWLDALAKQPDYTDPYFTDAAQIDDQGTTVYKVNSNVTITDKALTNRYTNGGN
jgi:Tfp pilus assembly protein PilN